MKNKHLVLGILILILAALAACNWPFLRPAAPVTTIRVPATIEPSDAKVDFFVDPDTYSSDKNTEQDVNLTGWANGLPIQLVLNDGISALTLVDATQLPFKIEEASLEENPESHAKPYLIVNGITCPFDRKEVSQVPSQFVLHFVCPDSATEAPPAP